MKKQNKRSWWKRGSTLFELMASIAVFSTITLVGVQSVQITKSMSSQMLVNTNQQSKMGQTLNMITNDLVEARAGLGMSCEVPGMIFADGTPVVAADAPNNVCYGNIRQSSSSTPGFEWEQTTAPAGYGSTTTAPNYILKFLSFKVPEQTVDGYTSYKVIRYNWYYANHTIERRVTSSTGEVTLDTISRNIDSVAFESIDSSTIRVTISKGNQVMKADVCLRNR